MALNMETALKFTTKFEGGGLDQLKKNLQSLSQQSQVSKRSLDQLYTETKKLGAAAGNTVNSIQQQATALKSLRDNAEIGSRKFQMLTRDIDQLESRLKKLGNTSETTSKKLDFRTAGASAAGSLATGGGINGALGAAGGALAASGGAAGLVVAGGLAATAGLTIASVSNARALEEQSRKLRVMTTDSSALEAQIKLLVREQNYLTSTTEASAAAYTILQAGFSDSSDIMQILKASTLGATAGFTDIGTVADATTTILAGYGLQVSEAGRIVDQMKVTTDDGKISMENYAQSIGRLIPSAAALKIPLAEINAAISALTVQGVPIESTFSGMNQILKTVIKPTKEATELSKALGLEFNAQAIAAKGLGGFLEDVASKTGKSSDALGVLFSDIDGYKAVVALLNDDLQRFNKFTDNQATAIGKTAAATEKAIDPVKRFDNAWKDLTSSVGILVLPTMYDVVNGLSAIIRKLQSLPELIKIVAKAAIDAANKSINPLGSLIGMIVNSETKPVIAPSTTLSKPKPVPQATIPTAQQTARANLVTQLARQLQDGGSDSKPGGDLKTNSFKLSSQGQALVKAASKLGVSPLDLATIIGFETAGTYNPSKMGGAGNNYMGLIQFGAPERKQYGAYKGQSFEEQVQGPVVRYLKDRFAGVGMSTEGADLLTLYRTVLGGNPKANINAKDAFGTSPASGVSMMGGHRQESLKRFFGGNIANVGYGSVDAAENAAQGFEQAQALAQKQLEEKQKLAQLMKERLASAVALSDKAQFGLNIAKATTDEERLTLQYNRDRSDRMEKYIVLQYESQGNLESENLAQAQALESLAAKIIYEKDLADIRERQLKAILDMGDALGSTVFQSSDANTAAITKFDPFSGYADGIGTMNDALNNLATSGFKGLEDAMVSLATTGKANFTDFAAAMLQDTARLIIQQLVLKQILQAVGAIGSSGSNFNGIEGFNPSMGSLSSGFSGFDPGAFSMDSLSSGLGNNIVPYAKGGVVNSPTLFKFAKGTGLMGEAGPEAILPLRRGADGNLGVAATVGGGGDVNVNVQVDATGTKAEGDPNISRQLGGIIADAVKSEIIRQKRPGGILSN